MVRLLPEHSARLIWKTILRIRLTSIGSHVFPILSNQKSSYEDFLITMGIFANAKMPIVIVGGSARIRTWIPGFGDQSLAVGRHSPAQRKRILFLAFPVFGMRSAPLAEFT